MEEYKKYILGDLSLTFYAAFFTFVLIGIMASLLLHYGNKTRKQARVGKRNKFRFGYWLKDNTMRILTSIVCVFIFVRFYDVFKINYELNMFVGLLSGMFLDRLIIFIRNKTSVNIFQSAENV